MTEQTIKDRLKEAWDMVTAKNTEWENIVTPINWEDLYRAALTTKLNSKLFDKHQLRKQLTSKPITLILNVTNEAASSQLDIVFRAKDVLVVVIPLSLYRDYDMGLGRACQITTQVFKAANFTIDPLVTYEYEDNVFDEMCEENVISEGVSPVHLSLPANMVYKEDVVREGFTEEVFDEEHEGDSPVHLSLPANMDGYNILDLFYACFEGVSTTVYQAGDEAKDDYEDRTITLIARQEADQTENVLRFYSYVRLNYHMFNLSIIFE